MTNSNIKNIALYYPPFTKNNKYPLITQNRQFKYTNSNEIKIFPVIMATLATMLKEKDYNVLFLDAVTKRMTFEDSLKKLETFSPDLIVMETKAPIIDDILKISENLKKNFNCRITLCGDHASAFPVEICCDDNVDFVVTSGYYDFIISELIENINHALNEQQTPVYPPGVFYKTGLKDHSVNDDEDKKNAVSGTDRIYDYDLEKTPLIDRNLTDSHLYGEAYLYSPAAYILSGRGCGGPAGNHDYKESTKPGKCAFCIWQHALWRTKAKLRSPAHVATEIEDLVLNHNIKEIFDDNESGAVWSTSWLNEFYKILEEKNLIGKFVISSNARADELTEERIPLLKKIGYRLLKIGLESANDKTLEILHKDETFKDIEKGIKRARDAGFVTLLTTMVGYPWENESDAENTYKKTKSLMLYKTKFGDSLQSSIIVPYPGSPLYKYAEKHDLLTENGKDYKKYDMEHKVLKSEIDVEKFVKKMWKIHLHPLFLLQSFFSLRKFDDIKLAWRGLLSLLGHLKDY